MLNLIFKRSETEIKESAFTLIELLIVVLIIAILAAIAVPNFLEFQTRAKISRAQADMRSIAVAIEAYAVDNGRYHVGYVNLRQSVSPAPTEWTAVAAGGNKFERLPLSYSYLTSPIAYLTTAFIDPFTVNSGSIFDRTADTRPEGDPYWYDDYQKYNFFTSNNGFAYSRFEDIADRGYRWSLSCAGPGRQTMMMWYALDGVDPASANDHVVFAYDPTNGTISEGFVARTNRGVFTEVNQD